MFSITIFIINSISNESKTNDEAQDRIDNFENCNGEISTVQRRLKEANEKNVDNDETFKDDNTNKANRRDHNIRTRYICKKGSIIAISNNPDDFKDDSSNLNNERFIKLKI